MTPEDASRYVSLANWEDAPADIKFLVDLVRRVVNTQLAVYQLASWVPSCPHSQGLAMDTLGPNGEIIHHVAVPRAK